MLTILLLLACSSNDNQNKTPTFDPEATKKMENMFISKEELDLLAHPEKDSFYRKFGGEYGAVMHMGGLRNLPAIVVINQLKECTFSYTAIYPNAPVETQREMGILKFKSATGNTEYYTFSNGDSKYDVALIKNGDSRFIEISGYNWRLSGKLKNNTEENNIDSKSSESTNNAEAISKSINECSHFPFDNSTDEVTNLESFSETRGLTFESDRFGYENSCLRFTNNPTNVQQYLKQIEFKKRETYSISVWFYCNKFYLKEQGTNYYYQSIIGIYPKSYNYGPALSLSLRHTDNSSLCASHWTQTDKLQSVYSESGSIEKNKWYNAVMMYDGDYLYLYLNGNLINKIPANLSYDNQSQLLVGGAGDGPNPGGIYGGFNGMIDDLRIYDRVLSEEEISALFHMER